jgi:hypothetical protein
MSAAKNAKASKGLRMQRIDSPRSARAWNDGRKSLTSACGAREDENEAGVPGGIAGEKRRWIRHLFV